MKTHIAIATTQGLVFIRKLTREDTDVMSLVCLNDTSKQLAISRAYADFVKKGSGLIERDFGHPAWRLDIGANIDTGESWQLPVYLAHCYHREDRLGNGHPVSGDRVIIATGEVRSTHETVAVEHINKKYVAANDSIVAFQQADVECIWVVSPGNMADLPVDANKVSMPRVDTAADVLQGTSGRRSIKAGARNAGSRGTVKRAMTVVILVILALAGGVWFQSTQQDENLLDDFAGRAQAKLAEEPLIARKTRLKIMQNEDPFLCDHDSATAVYLQADSGGAFTETSLASTCAITLLQVGNRSSAYLYALDSGAWRELSWQGGAEAGWRVPLPDNHSKNRPYMMIIFKDSLSRSKIQQIEHALDAISRSTTDLAGQVTTVTRRLGGDVEIYFHRLLVR